MNTPSETPAGIPVALLPPHEKPLPERLPHEAASTIGRAAIGHIAERDRQTGRSTEAAATLAELEALRPVRPIERFRQHKALRSWLERHHYPSYSHARSDLRRHQKSGQATAEALHEELQPMLEEARTQLAGFTAVQRQRADRFLRHHGLSEELVSACDSTATEQKEGRNLIDWLTAPSGEARAASASNDQLEAVLTWNAAYTERLAANSDLVQRAVDHYQKDAAQCVREGMLDPAFMHEPMRIRKVVVGDMLDPNFLGVGDMSRNGQYHKKSRALLIWPYELPADDNTDHVVKHEMTHAKGGFVSPWLEEGYTERFNLIVAGKSPNDADSAYPKNRSAIHELQSKAPQPLTDREASACFAGEDHARNQQQLRAAFRRAYQGVDTLGIVDDVFAMVAGTGNNPRFPISTATHHQAAEAAQKASTHIGNLSKLVFANPTLGRDLAAAYRKHAAEATDLADEAVYTAVARFCQAIDEAYV